MHFERPGLCLHPRQGCTSSPYSTLSKQEDSPLEQLYLADGHEYMKRLESRTSSSSTRTKWPLMELYAYTMKNPPHATRLNPLSINTLPRKTVDVFQFFTPSRFCQGCCCWTVEPLSIHHHRHALKRLIRRPNEAYWIMGFATRQAYQAHTFSGGIPTIRQTLNGTQPHKSISKINQVAKPMSAVWLWLIFIKNSTRICPSGRKHCPKNLIIALKNLHSRHAYLSADTKWPVDENADCSGCRRLVDCCCVHVLTSIGMALTWQPRNRLWSQISASGETSAKHAS